LNVSDFGKFRISMKISGILIIEDFDTGLYSSGLRIPDPKDSIYSREIGC